MHDNSRSGLTGSAAPVNQHAEELSLDELIKLAKSRGILDDIHEESDGYQLTIGAGIFHLDRNDTRTMLERMLYQRSGDVQ